MVNLSKQTGVVLTTELTVLLLITVISVSILLIAVAEFLPALLLTVTAFIWDFVAKSMALVSSVCENASLSNSTIIGPRFVNDLQLTQSMSLTSSIGNVNLNYGAPGFGVGPYFGHGGVLTDGFAPCNNIHVQSPTVNINTAL